MSSNVLCIYLQLHQPVVWSKFTEINLWGFGNTTLGKINSVYFLADIGHKPNFGEMFAQWISGIYDTNPNYIHESGLNNKFAEYFSNTLLPTNKFN